MSILKTDRSIQRVFDVVHLLLSCCVVLRYITNLKTEIDLTYAQYDKNIINLQAGILPSFVHKLDFRTIVRFSFIKKDIPTQEIYDNHLLFFRSLQRSVEVF